MDSVFVDLDILLLQVREPESKEQILEAVTSYRAGALRAAITATWTAAVFDILLKFRELSHNDNAAKKFIEDWDRNVENNNVDKLLRLEGDIVKTAADDVKIFDQHTKALLLRLKEDRNWCAHPAFSTSGRLFRPTSESVRAHLVIVIKSLLSIAPQQGRAIFEEFSADLMSIGFPSERAETQQYISEKYLKRIRSENTSAFAMVLTKSLLRSDPDEWNSKKCQVRYCLEAVRELRHEVWSVTVSKIVKLIEGIEPKYRNNCILFLSRFPDVWSSLSLETQNTLIRTIDKSEFEKQDDFNLFIASDTEFFKPSLSKRADQLSHDQLKIVLKKRNIAHPIFLPRVLVMLKEAKSEKRIESIFSDLVIPLSLVLDLDKLKDLLSFLVSHEHLYSTTEFSDNIETLFITGGLVGQIDSWMVSELVEILGDKVLTGSLETISNFFHED